MFCPCLEFQTHLLPLATPRCPHTGGSTPHPLAERPSPLSPSLAVSCDCCSPRLVLCPPSAPCRPWCSWAKNVSYCDSCLLPFTSLIPGRQDSLFCIFLSPSPTMIVATGQGQNTRVGIEQTGADEVSVNSGLCSPCSRCLAGCPFHPHDTAGLGSLRPAAPRGISQTRRAG